MSEPERRSLRLGESTLGPPIRISLLGFAPPRADEIARSLQRELSCQVAVRSEVEELLGPAEEPGESCEVLVTEGRSPSARDAAGGGAAPEWLARLRERPDPPEILLLLDPETALASSHLLSGEFLALKLPLLEGELAGKVRRAAENRRQRGSHRRAEELERLRKVSLAITSTLDRKSLLESIIPEAVDLLKAQSGGLYELNAERGELTVIAEFRRPERLGARLRVGEGLAGWLVQNEEQDYVIEDDYGTSKLKAEGALHAQPPFGALVEVKLRWQGAVLGVLYVDDAVGRKFTPEEAELLRLFADHAAIALGNSELMARSQAHRERLKDLALATREIMGDAQEKKLDERLDIIARHVAEVTDAQMAGVLLVRHPGVLILEATYGERDDGAKKGRSFEIKSGEKTGLTGAIAFDGKLVNLGYEELLNHPAVRRQEKSSSPSEICYSLLAIPLVRRKGDREILFGLLRAENKKGVNGQPQKGVVFTEEDVESIKIFADAVVVALELAERQDWLNRLVDSSPDGVIAIDRRARVTLFNQQAEQILGYTRSEAKRLKVHKLYADETEPARIGKLLDDSKVGRVDRHPTAVLSKDGVAIPIRHSSTWLYDSRGERIGSVGYFEDLREINLAELRLESLLEATSIVANATELPAGLAELTQLVAALVSHTFCRILLMEERGDFLRVEAVHVASVEAEDRAQLEATLWKSMAVASWPGLLERLEAGHPYVLEASQESGRASLARLSDWLGLSSELQGLLLAPLCLERQVVGLIEFGELRPGEHGVFRQDEIDFSAQIAAHTTALINRMRLLGEAERRGHQLAALDEASRTMQEQPEPSKLFPELARLAAELVSCDAGALFLNRRQLKEVELVAQHGISDQWRWVDEGRSQGQDEGLVGEVVRCGELRTRLDWTQEEERDPVLREIELRTAAAVPLRFLGDIVAVLFVGDSTGRQRFAKADREVLERFAAHASIALRVSDLISPEMRSMRHFRLLHKMTHFIHQEDDSAKIMDVMLTGITAGYGLGFNRAAILLVHRASAGSLLADELGTPPLLEGRAAIGDLTKEEAERSWEVSRQRGLDDFETYLRLLRSEGIGETPLGREIQSVTFPLSSNPRDRLSKAVLENRWALLKGRELDELPGNFYRVFAPANEIVVVPLEARNEVRGLLVADNKFTSAPITPESVETLLTFVSTLSISLDNRRLYTLSRDASERLGRLFSLSNRIAALRGPQKILDALISDVPGAVDAAWVRLILLDRLERLWSDPEWVLEEKVAHISTVRPDGNSTLAIRTRNPVVIEDLSKHAGIDSPFMKQRGIPAAICLPLWAHETSLGVLWINYREPRRFQPFEVEALLLFAGQVAVALDNALRLDELERLRAAVQKISLPTTLEEVLHAVARGALELSGGNSSVVWPYDWVRGAFVPTEALLSGVTQKEFGSFVLIDDDGEMLAKVVAERGSLAVPNLVNELAEPALKLVQLPLLQAGVCGFQGVALRVNEELVGVLYVNYHESGSFGERSLQLLSAYANHAGLAVKNARHFDRVRRAKEAAESVAHMTKLENLAETLKSVARSTCTALRCDSVVIFTYDPRARQWSYPPTFYGVRFPEMAWPRGGAEAIPNSIVAKVLQLDEPYVATDVKTDPLLGGHHFAVDEGISACCAWPLRAAGERVGVMFVNFKVPYHFKPDVRADIELFADQAAVAIRVQQLLDALKADALLDFQHQIRSPIAQAHARILEASRREDLSPDLRREMETIAGLSAKAERVSNNIRLFVSLSQGQLIQATLDWHPVPILVKLLQEAATGSHSLLGRYRQVSYELDEEGLRAWADRRLFLNPELADHALGNVLDNAFKYSSSGKVVRIGAGVLPGGRFFVSVSNEGLRISAAEVPLATQRGWQSEDARYSSKEGKGLGLWITMNIMRTLGGEVEMLPTTLEGWTEVRLIFNLDTVS